MDKKIIQNMIKGTSATTIGTIVTMGFHFISIYFLARYLTVKEFGFYALIFSISNLLNLLSSLGLEISIVKYIAEGSTIRDKVLKPTLLLKTAGTLIFIILFIIGYRLYPTNTDESIWNYNIFILIIFILGSYRDLFYRILQGLNKFRNYTYIQITSASARVALILLLIYLNKFDFLSLLYIEVFTALLSVTIQTNYIPFKSLLNKSDLKTDYKYLLKFSIPLYANNLITFIYDRIGVFIIGVVLTASSVAIFDVASKLPGAIQGILSSFILVFFPNISSLFSIGDKENAEELLNQSLNFFSVLLSIFSLIVFLWRNEIVTLFFSVKYLASAIPLSLFMFSLMIRFFANVLGYSIVSAGYSRIPMKVNAIAMIVGILSTWLFVNFWGYTGAVFATILLNLVSFIQYLYYFKTLELGNVELKFLNPVTVLIIISLFIYLLNISNQIINFVALSFFLIINLKELLSFKTLLFPTKIKTMNV